MGHLTKLDAFGRSKNFFYHFIVMKTSLSGALNKWDTSLSGTLFSVSKLKMNLIKWDIVLFETPLEFVFITFQGISSSLQKLGIINLMSMIMKIEESMKECEGEKEKEEITLSKALGMTDKLKMYCLRNRFTDAHLQVSSIRYSR